MTRGIGKCRNSFRWGGMYFFVVSKAQVNSRRPFPGKPIPSITQPKHAVGGPCSWFYHITNLAFSVIQILWISLYKTSLIKPESEHATDPWKASPVVDPCVLYVHMMKMNLRLDVILI